MIQRRTIAAVAAVAGFASAFGAATGETTLRRATLASDHISSSGIHKLVVSADDTTALVRLTEQGRVQRSIDYGSYRLLLVDDDTLGLLADPTLHRVQLRDDLDLIGLNGWTIDTRVGEPPDLPTVRMQDPAIFPWQLYVVQFVGTLREEWVNRLTSFADVQVVDYVPYNAAIVRATPSGWERLCFDQDVQWCGVFHPAYRIAQSLEPLLASQATVDVVVQTTDSPAGPDIEARIVQGALATFGGHAIDGVRSAYLRVPSAAVPVIAGEPEVLWIEPLSSAISLDERQAMTVAGQVFVNLAGQERPLEPPLDDTSAYWTWLTSKQLTGPFSFKVDIADSGFDIGSSSDIHSDFLDVGQNSRIAYLHDCTIDSPDWCNPSPSPTDVSDPTFHGTLVASVVGGRSIGTAPEDRDDPSSFDNGGYRYGLGLAPTVELGITKIVDGVTITADRVAAAMNLAYAEGARISNNSWREDATLSTYTTVAQQIDALIHDAVPGTAGRQELTMVFAAGNLGPAENAITPPATAKNVITVGASESFRQHSPPSTDIPCGGDEDADEHDNTQDMALLSSRGPTADGRSKPDLVAPGTRVTGVATRKRCDPVGCGFLNCSPDDNWCWIIQDPTSGCYPDPEASRYTLSSGTSFAAPAVTGAAALVRQDFLNQFAATPSPAMVKAVMLASAAYLPGLPGAEGVLPSRAQGYGRLNLGTALDGSPSQRVDQTHKFTAAGQVFTLGGTVSDGSKPFRVMLVWTDRPPVVLGGNAWRINLDLEVLFPDVEGDALLYHGNHFAGANSVCIELLGVPPPRPECVIDPIVDPRNNTEAVFLPAGAVATGTPYQVRVRAIDMGVLKQGDFALFVYNGAP